MRIIMVAAWLLFAGLFGGVAQASVVENYISIHLSEDQISPMTDSWGNLGEQLYVSVPMGPFLLHTGETLVTHISFDNYLSVSDIGNGVLNTTNYARGQENIHSYYLFATDPRSTGFSTVASSISLRLVAGEALTTLLPSSGSTYGSGMMVASTGDLTTSTAVLSGLDISTQILDFNITSGPGYVNLWTFFMLAGDFSILKPIPEPASLALLGLGLVGLGFSRRKKA